MPNRLPVIIGARYLTSRVVCQRYGNCQRTLDRWIKDPALKFPAPLDINGRRYFLEEHLQRWEDERLRASLVERGKPVSLGSGFAQPEPSKETSAGPNAALRVRVANDLETR